VARGPSRPPAGWDAPRGVHAHSLEAQIAGQLEAGFTLTGLFEDGLPHDPVSRFFPPCIATRAVRGGRA
jgi:hypothetical protein